MDKRGAIWISVVIYIGLGIIAITLILAAGLPLIEKMRDRNTFEQTRGVLHEIDFAVSDVINGGPGNARFFDVAVRKGRLFVTEGNPGAGGGPSGGGQIYWEMETRSILQEPGTTINDGNLKITFDEHPLLVDIYVVTITIDYFNAANILIETEEDLNGYEGRFSMNIEHKGITGSTDINPGWTRLAVDVL